MQDPGSDHTPAAAPLPTEGRVHAVVSDAAPSQAVVLFLQARRFQVEVHASGATFLAGLTGAAPGCVVLNLQLADLDGLEVLRRMTAAGSRLPVIVLDGHDLKTAVLAMKAGAMEFLERPYDHEELLAALAEGFALIESGRFNSIAGDAAREALARLTPRELEVLQGLMAGEANKEIARAMGVSPRTVELHRANLMDKLGVRGLSAAVRIALAAGLDLTA